MVQSLMCLTQIDDSEAQSETSARHKLTILEVTEVEWVESSTITPLDFFKDFIYHEKKIERPSVLGESSLRTCADLCAPNLT